MKDNLGPVVLVAALLGTGVVQAQAPGYAGGYGAGNNVPIATAGDGSATLPMPNGNGDPARQRTGATSMEQSPPGLTDYLSYLRPEGCCGPIGRHGPINCEIFLRPGVSFPTGGSFLAKVLEPGFMIQGGARTLFYNPARDLAWTVELGISSAWYDAGRDQVAILNNIPRLIPNQFGPPSEDVVPALPVIPSSLNQTYVHLSGGHEIYLWGNGDCGDDNPKWRVGYDLGGRWGSAKLMVGKQRFPEDNDDPNRGLFRHLTDVVGGVFGALHTDLECPYKCAMFQLGLRAEVAHIWADLLQPQNNTDLMMINFLVNFGVRF